MAKVSLNSTWFFRLISFLGVLEYRSEFLEFGSVPMAMRFKFLLPMEVYNEKMP